MDTLYTVSFATDQIGEKIERRAETELWVQALRTERDGSSRAVFWPFRRHDEH